MKISLIISCLFTLFFLAACIGPERFDDGYYEEGKYYFNNGEMGEGELLKGKMHGLWAFRNADRTPKSRGTYQYGIQEGRWTFFFPDSRLMSEGDFKNGQRSGVWNFWWENGNLKEVRNYFGQENLLLSAYFEDGKPMVEGGLGEYFFYHDGKLREHGWYANSRPDSTWVVLDEKGDTTSTMLFRNGIQVE